MLNKDTPNGFTAKDKDAKPWNDTRAGLGKLIDYIDQNAEAIHKQRAARDLPNRN
jgi:hypothetical protein